MLTISERDAARGATVWKGVKWGRGEKHCPTLAVGLRRGLPFVQDAYGYWFPREGSRPAGWDQRLLAEVAEWLGFSTIRTFLSTLQIEKQDIFDRAVYGRFDPRKRVRPL